MGIEEIGVAAGAEVGGEDIFFTYATGDCMVHFIYRLNIFGSKAAREKMMNSGRRGFGGGVPGRLDGIPR